MFVFRYLKLLFRILVDIRQTSKWSFLTRMCFALSIHTNFTKILSSSLTLLGPQFVIWRRPFTWTKVDRRSPIVDGTVSFIGCFTWTSTTSLFSVTQPVWYNYQNCSYWLLWSLTSLTGDFITKRSQYWDNNIQSSWSTQWRHRSTSTLIGRSSLTTTMVAVNVHHTVYQ